MSIDAYRGLADKLKELIETFADDAGDELKQQISICADWADYIIKQYDSQELRIEQAYEARSEAEKENRQLQKILDAVHTILELQQR